MPGYTVTSSWNEAEGDDWFASLPWSQEARDREERNRHMVRRVARHYHDMWDSAWKRALHHGNKRCFRSAWQGPRTWRWPYGWETSRFWLAHAQLEKGD